MPLPITRTSVFIDSVISVMHLFIKGYSVESLTTIITNGEQGSQVASSPFSKRSLLYFLIFVNPASTYYGRRTAQEMTVVQRPFSPSAVCVILYELIIFPLIL